GADATHADRVGTVHRRLADAAVHGDPFDAPAHVVRAAVLLVAAGVERFAGGFGRELRGAVGRHLRAEHRGGEDGGSPGGGHRAVRHRGTGVDFPARAAVAVATRAACRAARR